MEQVINPGEGFWIKGPLTLSYSCIKPYPSASPLNSFAPVQPGSSITFTDENGRTSTLYFSENPSDYPAVTQYDLPPVPPSGAFDVRFASNRYAECFPADEKNQEHEISLRSSHGPVTIKWNITDGSQSVYEISQESPYSWRQTITGSGSITMPPGGDRNLRLIRANPGIVPRSFGLGQNYPNPFNPSTTITINLPQLSVVSLKVYNTIGQLVAVPADRAIYPAGQAHITFTADNLPSGVYYYSADATSVDGGASFRSTKKMILIQ